MHLELVVVGGPLTSGSMPIAAAAVDPFPADTRSGGMVTLPVDRSNDWPTISTEAGATTDDSNDEAEC